MHRELKTFTFRRCGTLRAVMAAAALLAACPDASGGTEGLRAAFLGGEARDSCREGRLTPDGKLVVVGGTSSTSFPVTSGAYQTVRARGRDGYVAVLDPETFEVLAATYFGGEADDEALSVAVAVDGEIVVAGYTGSSDLPATNDSSFKGGAAGVDTPQPSDVFVVRFSSDLQELSYATYLGGSSNEHPTGIRLHPSGDLVVAGLTFSTDLETTAGCFQPAYAGGRGDRFVARLRPGGGPGLLDQVVYLTYLGGSGDEAHDATSFDDAWVWHRPFALDRQGNAVLAGDSTSGDFPVSPGAHFSSLVRSSATLTVLRLETDVDAQDQLLYSGTFGGDSWEGVTEVLVAADGTIWLGGYTFSPNFPTTAAAYQRTGVTAPGGLPQAFLAHVQPDPGLDPEEQLLYATYLGAATAAEVYGLELTDNGHLLVTGTSGSSGVPTSRDATHPSHLGGVLDGFFLIMDPRPEVPSAQQVLHGTYLGGSSFERLESVLYTATGQALLLGSTQSSTFSGASRLPPAPQGNENGVVVAIDAGFLISAPRFRRGDVDGSRGLDLSDAIRTLGYLFLGGEAPSCLDAADANDSGVLDLSDAVALLDHLFLGGRRPPAPYPDCGRDPTSDALGCGSFASCP